MANSVTPKILKPGTRELVVSLDANGNVVLGDLSKYDSITLHATGTFGGGTLALEAGNDETNFAALPTAVSLTAAGIKSVAADGLGYKSYRLALSGATSPSITVTLVAVARAFASSVI